MNLCLDRHVISFPLDEELLARWSASGTSTPPAHPLKAAWALLLSRVSGVPKSKFGVIETPMTSVVDPKINPMSSELPHVETWAISENADIALRDAAEESTECLVEAEATSAIIISWDGETAILPSTFQTVVLLNCGLSPAQMYMSFSREFLTISMAWAQLACCVRLLEQMILTPDLPLFKVDFLGSYGEKTIRQWNNPYSLSRPNVCIHTLIQEQCHSQPEAEALCAWDGSVTYAELDRLSLAISILLQTHGVGSNTTVPLLFEKSQWTAIAILGVLRAGGAFVLLDPTHPVHRLEEICIEVEATVVLTSRSLHELGGQVHRQAIAVPRAEIEVDESNCHRASIVNPSNAAYIAFTSGSTGKPKGIVIEHRSFCANALAQNAVQNLNSQTRAFQFAAHAFDSSILEMLMTLIAGGCVCIPSEEQRLNGLSNAINTLQANWLELTPSVARFLQPDLIPGVKSLLLVGEPMSRKDVSQWADRVQLLNAYGPAECSVVTTIQSRVKANDPQNIGRSYSGHCWIVNPHDQDQLEPLGAVGELIVSGPIVARGYLNYPRQTSFISTPRWATRFGVPEDERFYRTGDLARYNVDDGTLQYIGRKDREVKIHGQRIDLQEIEYLASQYQNEVAAVVDVIQLGDSSAGKLLTIFLAYADKDLCSDSCKGQVVSADAAMRSVSVGMKGWLQDCLPPYMIPTKYVWVTGFPLTRTGKLDRRALIDLGTAATRARTHNPETESSTMDGHEDADFDPDMLSKEDLIRSLFAEVLDCPGQVISIHDDFYELGGNSLAAIELVARARSRGLEVTVAEVIRSQTAHKIARSSLETAESPEIPPFALLGNHDREEILSNAVVQCQVMPSQIEDIYPCTPLQEGLMSLSIKRPGAFIGTYQFSLPSSTSVTQLRAAWERLWVAHPILRTRIVSAKDGTMMQVVIKENLLCREGLCADDVRRSMGFGTPLARLTIQQLNTPVLFIITIHHAIFDGWSYVQLLEDLHSFYQGQLPPPRPAFTQYIRYLASSDSHRSRSFWKDELKDYQSPVFPSSLSRWPSTLPQWLVKSHQVSLAGLDINWKLANQIKLAWALVVSSQSNSDDVIYGLTVTGRNAPVSGIDRITGPTFTTFPFRTQLNQKLSVQQTLAELQEHDVSLMPYEHTGLKNIAESSPEAAWACGFQNLLTVRLRSSQSTSSAFLDLPENEAEDLNFASYPLSIVVQQKDSLLKIKAFYDGEILTPSFVQDLLDDFETFLQHVIQQPQSIIGDLKSLMSQRWQQVAEINTETHDHPSPRCLHDAIQGLGITQPEWEAVCAWDGSLTYEELITMGRTLAGHLQLSGSGPGTIIGICLRRTRLFPVAILGVLMSGAAMVLLEPDFPPQRLSWILNDVDAQFVICSPGLQEKFEGKTKTTRQIIPFAWDLGEWKSCDSWLPPPVSPSDPMYVAFTSGSTGTPKGVVIEHGMVYSTIHAHKDAIGAAKSSRCLLFASPAFDICLAEIFFMLATGGCVCIPSESQRMNSLGETMSAMRVNMAMLTPSVARTLSPEKVPSLQTLILGGESPSASDLATWAPRVRLHQSYGPAECTMYASTTPQLAPNSVLNNVGSSLNATYWIVNPEDHNELMPVGSMGELLIGGPLVGRGYINRPKESAAAFIQDPAWSQQIPALLGSRLYKTGDLAILNRDKSLLLIGRKDTQVKLHGQRIELHEVERCAEGFGHDLAVIVELAEIQSVQRSSLVAFAYNPVTVERTLAMTPALGDDQMPFLPPSADNRQLFAGLRQHLQQHLAPFMVPSLMLELSCLPLSPTGKIDRKTLRHAASMLDTETLRMHRGGVAGLKTEPVSPQEQFVRASFATALSLDEQTIGLDDNFFALGGDSLSAMRVLTLCRRGNMNISMHEFLSHDTVSSLCAYVRSYQDQCPDPAFQKGVTPKNHSESESSSVYSRDVAHDFELIRSQLTSLQSHNIEDIYPCSDAHNGILELYTSQYTSTAIFQILPGGSLSAVQVSNAWNHLVKRHAALRTILVDDPKAVAKKLQVVLHPGILQDPICASSGTALADLRSSRPVQSWDLSPLYRLFIRQDDGGEVFMRLETGGALIDAFSMSILMRELCLILDGQPLPSISVTYRQYLTHLQQQRPSAKALQYWSHVLYDSQPSHLSRRPEETPSPSTPPSPRAQTRRLSPAQFHDLNAFWRAHRLTITNICQLAWALTLGQYTNTREVCFGTVTSGREDLDVWDSVGSFFNILPCRLALEANIAVVEALNRNQAEIQRRTEHQNCSMPDMVRRSRAQPDNDLDQQLFNTVLTVQNTVSTNSHPARSQDKETAASTATRNTQVELLDLEDPTEYDFCLAVHTSPAQIEIELRYWTSTASEKYASEILARMLESLDLIVRNPTEPLQKIVRMES
ncbi:acetyl-CoA synthetase-like protein [Aspergillus brunneoviolaceus CBS 621.78]|uniref:Acetyl-CoA synthetase-like protein n=1 Tax=Aspergillus brunneoviolaceus CBS 621.78 TaxID=1450534 RepID=A0ACD1GEU5_9EURO|nr:acetyl-CoA synthetase-like protein [Aspergillus brunneoviolaceus CBS 621.78]RAH47819.1 acetyl-CoA synthetase-like protein [Aspergillus brunneoviolaceus CBS 621.78]